MGGGGRSNGGGGGKAAAAASDQPSAAKDIYYGDEDDEYGWDGNYEMDDADYTLLADEDETFSPGEPWVDDGDGAGSSLADGIFDVEEFDEIYANYQEARGKLNAMRTARGFYPVVALVQGPRNYGGGKKGGGKSPKSNKGKGRGKERTKQMPKVQRPPPDPKGRAAAALGGRRCLRCGQIGHLARNCPNAGEKKRKLDDDDDAAMMVEDDDMILSADTAYRLDDDDDDDPADDTAEWEDAPRGPKGEYILHLAQDLQQCGDREPDLVLMPEDVDSHVGNPIPMEQFLKEGIDDVMNAVDMDQGELMIAHDANQSRPRPAKDGMGDQVLRDEVPGRLRRLHSHVLRKMEVKLREDVRKFDKVLQVSQSVTRECGRPRLIWEVFAGLGRTSAYLEKYDNVTVEVFSLATGWDFQLASHRKKFLDKLRRDEPDDVLLSPMCRLWSPLQELSCHTVPGYRERLIADRKVNHDTIMMMCSVAMTEQYKNGRHGTLEHPWPSRAWSTKAMQLIEEFCYDTYVDQCQYGLKLPDRDGRDGPVKKPTCNIPGGGGPRSKAAENYPPALARMLAKCMTVDCDEDVFAEEDAEMLPEDDPGNAQIFHDDDIVVDGEADENSIPEDEAVAEENIPEAGVEDLIEEELGPPPEGDDLDYEPSVAESRPGMDLDLVPEIPPDGPIGIPAPTTPASLLYQDRQRRVWTADEAGAALEENATATTDMGYLFDFAMVVTFVMVLVGLLVTIKVIKDAMIARCREVLRTMKAWCCQKGLYLVDRFAACLDEACLLWLTLRGDQENEIADLRNQVVELSDKLDDARRQNADAEWYLMEERDALGAELDEVQDWEARWYRDNWERISLQNRVQMLVNRPCWFTHSGERWHLDEHCPTLRGSRRIENKEMLMSRKMGCTFGLQPPQANPYKPGDRYMHTKCEKKKVSRLDPSKVPAAGVSSYSQKLEGPRRSAELSVELLVKISRCSVSF
eukprot:Skav235563  [mRNA]  locus=scaffold3067:381891:390381:- [translate_table: standard]